MTDVKVTIIGDVVDSRAAPDRANLHDRLVEALEAVNDEYQPAEPLRLTVGDEYQGCFESLGVAITAALRIRLRLLPDFDVRHGLGLGAVSVLDASPRVEDGPGWWAAREAIVAVKTDQAKAALRHVRTAYRRAEDTAGPDPAAINAALLTRDHLIGAASPPSLGVLGALLGGASQVEIARSENISASAVSQRIRRDGLAVITAADDLLGGIT